MKVRLFSIYLLLSSFIYYPLQAKVKVTCVGNSITYGYGLANPKTDSYPSQLQQLLGEEYEVGNFGHNKLVQGSNGSRVQGYYWRKFNSFWGRLSDMLRHFQLFPKDSIVFFGGVLRSGLHAAMRGE